MIWFQIALCAIGLGLVLPVAFGTDTYQHIIEWQVKRTQQATTGFFIGRTQLASNLFVYTAHSWRWGLQMIVRCSYVVPANPCSICRKPISNESFVGTGDGSMRANGDKGSFAHATCYRKAQVVGQ